MRNAVMRLRARRNTLKSKSVKGETLTHFRNRARLMDDETSDCGRFLVGQIPIHHAV